MGRWFRDWKVTLVIVAAAAMWGAEQPTDGQAQGFVAPRLQGTQRPNLSGVWQAVNTANYDIQNHAARPALAVRPGPSTLTPQGPVVERVEVPHAAVLAFGAAGGVPAGLGVVEDNEIPYQPWAAQQKAENAADWLTRDPEIKCYMPGVPRATYMPYPFQIVQSTDKVMILYEFANALRVVHMDSMEPPPVDSWMGHSIGRWDGDTLVVDVSGFNGDTWFDRAGNFHSEAMRVTERYTPLSPYHLTYDATIEDPKVFTRPWTMRMVLYRRMEPNIHPLEYKCTEFVEELMYGHLRKDPTDVVDEYRAWYRDSRPDLQ